MEKKSGKRKGRRGRFRSGIDDEQQLRELERAKKLAREGKLRVLIESDKKSRQRLTNRLRQIHDVDDAKKQFEG